jgi:hypothetical protein
MKSPEVAFRFCRNPPENAEGLIVLEVGNCRETAVMADTVKGATAASTPAASTNVPAPPVSTNVENSDERGVVVKVNGPAPLGPTDI